MPTQLISKVIAALPATLTANTVYFVRVGTGFDLYVSDSTGTTAHQLNTSTIPPELIDGSVTDLHKHSELFDADGLKGLEVLTGGDLQAPLYPHSTRNDGTVNDHKSLYTDSNGRLLLGRVLPFYAFNEKISDDTVNPGINISNTFESYLQLDFTIPEAGVYELAWYYEWSYNNTTANFEANIEVDASVNIGTHREEPKDSAGVGPIYLGTNGNNYNSSTDQVIPRNGFKPYQFTAGNHSVRIMWRSQANGIAATIHRASLRIERKA